MCLHRFGSSHGPRNMLVFLLESIPWLALVALAAHCVALWPSSTRCGSEKLRRWAWEWLAPSWAACSLLAHFLLTRCPIICLGCAGDFYHELNAGIPWQGKCMLYDVVFSVGSLIVGVLGLLVGLFSRPGAARSSLLPQLVWYVGSAVSLRRAAVGLALGLGLFPQLFAGPVAHCRAAQPMGSNASLAVVSAFDHLRNLDATSCIQSAQQTFASRHGYSLVRPPPCEDFWRQHQQLLPEMSGLVYKRLQAGHFDMSCKLAAIFVTLTTRPEIDWVLWLDADAVVTDVNRRVEDMIPAQEVDFVLAMGAEAGGSLELPAGAWHRIFEHVPSWSTSAGHFNGGVLLARNSPRARAVLRRALELVDSGRDEDNDQRAIFDALREPTAAAPAGAAAGPPPGGRARSERAADGSQVVLSAGFERSLSVEGDVIRLPAAALRVVAPRCLNVHPKSWAPWNRWLPGDFIAHNWGANKEVVLLEMCHVSAAGSTATRAYLEHVAWSSAVQGAMLAAIGLLCLLACCGAGRKSPSVPSNSGFKEPAWCRAVSADKPARGYVRGHELSRCA